MTRKTFIRTAIISTVLLGSVIYLLSSRSGGEDLDLVGRKVGSSRDLSGGGGGSRGSSGGSGEGERAGGGRWGRMGNMLKSHKEVVVQVEDEESMWIDLDEEMPLTTYDGGLNGYQVFSNLYLSSSSLLAVTLPSYDTPPDTKPIPPAKNIMSGEKKNGQAKAAGEDRWRVIENPEIARDEMGRRAVYMQGTTYIFNDGPGPDGYLVYFSHFVVEAFLGATRVLASTFMPTTISLADSPDPIPMPKRIWFPRCGARPSWRDDKGENFWFLSHALPAATVEDASGWEDRGVAGLPILLEKVVIIDRWSSHAFGGEVGKWGKMNADVPTVPAQTRFWDPIRQNIMRSLGVDGDSDIGSRGLPVVVYVDRQKSKPKVVPSDHTAFVEALKGLTSKAEIHVTKLSSMTRSQQIALMGRAQIIIGVHGDEMLNALWMQPGEGSTVIEIFEEGGFVRDFELLATSLNLKYIAINKNKVLDEAAWRKMGAVRGPDKEGEIPIDGAFLAGVIEGVLDSMPTFTV